MIGSKDRLIRRDGDSPILYDYSWKATPNRLRVSKVSKVSQAPATRLLTLGHPTLTGLGHRISI